MPVCLLVLLVCKGDVADTNASHTGAADDTGSRGGTEDSSDPQDTGVEDSGDSAADSGEAPCEGTEPTIVTFEVENAGITSEGGTPSWRMTLGATDENGDLHEIAWSMWWDETLDSNHAGPAELTQIDAGDGGPCDATSWSREVYLQIGSALDYDTQYELTLIVTDAHGLKSLPAVTTAWTPNSDGSDGGP